MKDKVTTYFYKLIAFTLTTVLGLSSVVMPVNASQNAVDYSPETVRYRSVLYYRDASIWGGDNNFYPSAIPADQITHLYFASLDFDDDGELSFMDIDAAVDAPAGMTDVDWDAPNSGVLSAFQDLKAQNPNLRIGISIGGWTRSGDFAPMAADPSARSRFADNVCRFIKYTNMDAVDIDWRYPGTVRSTDLTSSIKDEGAPHSSPQDKANLDLLLEELRAALDQQEDDLGREYELSVTLPPTAALISAGYQIPSLFDIIDFANLMTFDMHGAWMNISGHQAALYANPACPPIYSVDESVNYLLTGGASADQIVIGYSLQTAGWEQVTDDGGVAGLPGLFGTAALINKNSDRSLSYGALNQRPIWGTVGSSFCGGIWDYGAMDLLMTGYPGLTEYWDDTAKASYLYNPDTGAFFTHESIRSLQAKTNYVKSKGMGGIAGFYAAWDRSTATGKRDELTRTVKNGLFGSSSLTHYTANRPEADVLAEVTAYANSSGNGYEITLLNLAAANETDPVLSKVEDMAETIKLPRLYIKTASGITLTPGSAGVNITQANGYHVVDLGNRMIPRGGTVTVNLKTDDAAAINDIQSIMLTQRIMSDGAEISRQRIYESTDALPPANVSPLVFDDATVQAMETDGVTMSGCTCFNIYVSGNTYDPMYDVCYKGIHYRQKWWVLSPPPPDSGDSIWTKIGNCPCPCAP